MTISGAARQWSRAVTAIASTNQAPHSMPGQSPSISHTGTVLRPSSLRATKWYGETWMSAASVLSQFRRGSQGDQNHVREAEAVAVEHRAHNLSQPLALDLYCGGLGGGRGLRARLGAENARVPNVLPLKAG